LILSKRFAFAGIICIFRINQFAPMDRKTPLYFLVISGFIIFCFFSCNKVTNPDHSSISNVVISSLRPEHGPYDTVDTLTGTGFDQIPTLDSVLLNGKKLTVISRSATQVIVQIPSLAGTGHIDIGYQGQIIEGPIFTYDSLLMVTTIAGTSDEGEVNAKGLDARFYNPVGIAVDDFGNIYVAEAGGSSIRKIDTGANVTTLAGPSDLQRGYADGPGASAMFSAPLGLTIDQTGNLYVGDQFNYRVRQVSPSGVTSTFAGALWDGIPGHGGFDGPGSVATFDAPSGVACDQAGNIYVADMYNNKIRKISPDAVVSSLAGGDYYHYGTQDGKGDSALFYVPTAIAVDPQGTVYTVDNENHLLRKITPDGTVTTLLGPEVPGLDDGNGIFSAGWLATDKNGNLFFTISVGIIEMTPSGQIIRYAVGGIGDNDGPALVATYRAITGITVDKNGTIFITDNNRIRKIAWQ
jgi:NHL repeat